MSSTLVAGAATADITPDGPQFLFGYPHVARISTGVHDRLLSSALYLCDGRTALLLVSNDVVAIGNETARRVRQRIEQRNGSSGSQHPDYGLAHPFRPDDNGFGQLRRRCGRAEG